MKILMIENEIYLAQSISAKLSQFGFVCDVVSSIDDALKFEKADIVLLSSNIGGADFYPVIEKFKKSIVIMMIPYVNDDTVTNPIKAGASDYIVKPFMIDELIRKIKHYTLFYQMQREITFYRDYFCHSMLIPSYSLNSKVSFPLIIKGISQKMIDMSVVNYAISKKFVINFISLYENEQDLDEVFSAIPNTQLTYVIGFELLSREKKEYYIKELKNTPVIFSALGGDLSGFKNVHDINIKEVTHGFHDDVLSVDEYIKTMIVKFEDRYPDTELSKKLGMSRKSLWEKRKKYGITKKK